MATDDDTSGIEEGEYIVEKIVNHMFRNDKCYFLLKWKGYDDVDNTWEEESSLNCPDLLAEYININADKIERDRIAQQELERIEREEKERERKLRKKKNKRKENSIDDDEFIDDSDNYSQFSQTKSRNSNHQKKSIPQFNSYGNPSNNSNYSYQSNSNGFTNKQFNNMIASQMTEIAKEKGQIYVSDEIQEVFSNYPSGNKAQINPQNITFDDIQEIEKRKALSNFNTNLVKNNSNPISNNSTVTSNPTNGTSNTNTNNNNTNINDSMNNDSQSNNPKKETNDNILSDANFTKFIKPLKPQINLKRVAIIGKKKGIDNQIKLVVALRDGSIEEIPRELLIQQDLELYTKFLEEIAFARYL
ncbi:hypothetical protein TRFO_19354 [Tritrichomonas foetus]|uniref:Chromo domain-containing protein n=1 Tax=Tritrichomonas foetus TaxID=1144522 RepID=A0A1J4KJ59_9EUKA|nr:hypothetical protein TRFO_19354 [Tritrichomonas foetus]|eukprot:OHT11259.1 hypothetical protein TRFO_19354 [Tritrichomonas foetus]